jgi:hypothetical protein
MMFFLGSEQRSGDRVARQVKVARCLVRMP